MSSDQLNKFSGTVHLGTDHAGFALKESVKAALVSHGFTVVDHTPDFIDGDDYPLTIRPAAYALAGDASGRAILFGKSGQGEAIVANRVPHVRAAVYTGGNLELVRLAREHNDANALSLGAGFLSDSEAWEAVQLFLDTPFSTDERHVRRVTQIDE